MNSYANKKLGIVDELNNLRAEIKSRNEAGTSKLTRTEGYEQSKSGATHSDTSYEDMSHHEAATESGNPN